MLEFTLMHSEKPIFINPSQVSAIWPHISSNENCYICFSGGDEHFAIKGNAREIAYQIGVALNADR